MTGDWGVSQLKLLKHYRASVLGRKCPVFESIQAGTDSFHLKFVTGGTFM